MHFKPRQTLLMKRWIAALLMVACTNISAQTLLTYGNEKVTTSEFVKSFQKNNQSNVSEASLKEYLDLYIASRLKIKEARERRFDTLPQMLAELQNLRQQIIPAYLNDKESLTRMVNEAFDRSKKDLQLAHIFIKNQGSTAATEKRKEEVLQALKKKSFTDVARELSDDPAAADNRGHLGWITVFNLPYALENLAYATPVGKVSAVYRSKSGYHILKNLGERKAVGKMKAAQILFAFPPNASQAQKAQIATRADSVYKKLQAGEDFGTMANLLSNDVVTSASNGLLNEFGVGEYDDEFTSAVFSLKKDGELSRPFTTAHGIHIVKRVAHQPISFQLTQEVKKELQTRVEQSDRILALDDLLLRKLKKHNGFTAYKFDSRALAQFTDSILQNQNPDAAGTIDLGTKLFSFKQDFATVSDWKTFVEANTERGNPPFSQLWDGFEKETLMKFYRDHLEDFSPEFKNQLGEFEEGNLFFEIMQQQVWTPAQTDSVALQQHFQKNKDRYNWKPSAAAVVFYAATEEAAKNFRQALQPNSANWRQLLETHDQVSADSGRFELTQLPTAVQHQASGSLSPVAVHDDNTATIYLLLKHYKETEPRSFEEARGLVINDYQAELEARWIQQLKKKYPVTMNNKAWKALVAELTRK